MAIDNENKRRSATGIQSVRVIYLGPDAYMDVEDRRVVAGFYSFNTLPPVLETLYFGIAN